MFPNISLNYWFGSKWMCSSKVFYILSYYLQFCKSEARMMDFIFIEYAWKLGYLRWYYVFVFCTLLFPLRKSRTQTLNSEYKLTRLILRIGCPSYLLTSDGRRKSALIRKPLAQIRKAFNQHDTSGEKIKYLGKNI